MLKGDFFKYELNFRFSAGTSRGVLRNRNIWYVRIWDDSSPEIIGIGECSPLPGLSQDPLDSIEEHINSVLKRLQNSEPHDSYDSIVDQARDLVSHEYPSVRFAFETALLDLLNGGKRLIIPSGFFEGRVAIPINGLIWMNEKEYMISQAQKKIVEGYNCIKMKIGAIHFEDEIEVLKFIRQNTTEHLVLRVDANGAFQYEDCLKKIDYLSDLEIHSIEQPINPGSWKQMSDICKNSRVPIALDEELIGMEQQREELLDTIKPQFIVLKPSLIGGLYETDKWIKLAEQRNIGWWVTSMLESNIGLNAIAQYVAGKAPDKIHGLGTGQLYTNNIDSPITIQNGHISYIPDKIWGNLE